MKARIHGPPPPQRTPGKAWLSPQRAARSKSRPRKGAASAFLRSAHQWPVGLGSLQLSQRVVVYYGPASAPVQQALCQKQSHGDENPAWWDELSWPPSPCLCRPRTFGGCSFRSFTAGLVGRRASPKVHRRATLRIPHTPHDSRLLAASALAGDAALSRSACSHLCGRGLERLPAPVLLAWR